VLAASRGSLLPRSCMKPVGKPTKCCGHSNDFNPLLLAAKPTTSCFGLLTVSGAVQLVGLVTVIEGFLQLGTWLPDVRWGPPSYDWVLQYVSVAIGLASICFGAACLYCTRSLRPHVIRRVKSFRRFVFVWTVLWFLLVGLPTEIVYASVPVIEKWPVSQAPGIPQKLIVDPEWPDGKPHVCGDINGMKQRLTHSLQSKSRNRFVRRVLRVVYKKLSKKVLPCRQVVRLFWVWMLAELALKFYCASVLGYFEMLVLNGSDGRMMIGDPTDLEKPVGERMGTKVMIRQQIEYLFAELDANNDGKVSLQELVSYVEGRKDM